MTHGLCGKEGAMVFKRVLKGIGRLMLTTAVMCGVGLFLCSSEVKAEVPDQLNGDGQVYFKDSVNNYEIVIDAQANKTYQIDTSSLAIVKDDKTVVDSTGFIDPKLSVVNSDNTNPQILTIATLPKSDLDTAVIEKVGGTLAAGTDFSIGGSVSLKAKVKIDSSEKISADSIYSKKIFKVDITKYDTGSTFDPDFSYEVNGKNTQFGYENDSYTITPEKVGFDINYYYDLVKKRDGFSVDTGDNKWREANVIKGDISSTQSDNELKVAYLPKIKTLAIDSVTGAKLSDTKDRIDIITAGTAPVYPVATYKIDGYKEDSETLPIGDALSKYSFVATVPSLPTLGTLRAEIIDPLSDGKCKVTASLMNTNTSGSGSIAISAKLGENVVCSVPLSVYVGVEPTGIIFQNVPISVMVGGGSQVVQVLKGIEPSGANQSPSAYTGTLTVTPSGVLDESSTNFKYNAATGEVTVKASSTATSGATATVTLTLDNGITTPIYKSFEVKIISFDKDKTISSIKNSNKNYITYNKDKGYSLDIKQLIIDNAKDSSGNSITIDKNQITEVKVGSTSCSEGTWKPSEASLNQKVSCKINGVEIEESDGLKVSAYPMPTATYSSSNRTLSVKIPTKVATAYSDDNNIRQSKGFKLILEDSSGNTLYEYTDSKYQNVLSSSSESTVSYTVTASDIEGMITSAASNGKFSADTTSVKFKVIPMGYKQSSTSDETIKAKDEIVGKTDAVTVYKVSASGTNFTSSAAYGLDGQTVSITATPNSGYSFKQWSDGNTSNPRQVKVSASGTRSFQAVAGDRVANSTGAGGTDNSELYDDVPKTAESNSAIWLIVFMVFAVMGTTYALYLQLRAANSKHDR